MNNNNYLGSSLFILHLDLNTRPLKQTEEEKTVELYEKNLHLLGPDGVKKLEKMKKKAMRRQVSLVDEVHIPPEIK
jgi:hypothetical protein